MWTDWHLQDRAKWGTSSLEASHTQNLAIRCILANLKNQVNLKSSSTEQSTDTQYVYII